MPLRPPDPDHYWLTAEEAAHLLGLDRRTFLRLVRQGHLPPAGLVLSRQALYWHLDRVEAVAVLLDFLVPPPVPVKPKSERPTGPK